MTDQQRGDCLSAAGHPAIRTPNMDRLAAEGVSFSRFYTTSPVCMPARSSFASGLYCHNHGQWSNYGRLPEDADTYMKRLRAEGYRTCHIGKSHLYVHEAGAHMRDFVPYMQALGFDDVLETTGPWATVTVDSMLTDHWKEKGICDLFRNDYLKRREVGSVKAIWPSPMPEGEGPDDFVGRTAVSYLEGYDRDEPFCTFVGFGGPHEPWDPPKSWAERYADTPPPDTLPPAEAHEWLSEAAVSYQNACTHEIPPESRVAIQRLYYAKISHVDEWFGKIFMALEKKGVLDNTAIVFWSDHGERCGDRNGLFKGFYYDESARVPFMVRTPDRLNAGKTAATLASTVDGPATILDLAGCKPGIGFGTSLLPAVRDPGARSHDAVFSEIVGRGANGKTSMIRTDQWKMVVEDTGEALQLFDMEQDPKELENLAGREDMRSRETDLRCRMLDWRLATETDQRTAE
jgi:choline-sulfatase